MDIREVPDGEFNRHPWEISRTKQTISVVAKYLTELYIDKNKLAIANIGAGDMYFDKEYLKCYPEDTIYAIDCEYKMFSSGADNIYMANDINKFNNVSFDVVILMNLMEYIQDETSFLEGLATHMQHGGIVFFILPAFQFLFSEHDKYVKGLRRYSDRRFKKKMKDIKGLEFQESFYFYSTLFLIRAIKKVLGIPTDKDQKNVPAWKYSRDHIITRLLTGLLNFDFRVCLGLQRIGLKLPGLSLFVVCVRE